MYIKLHCYNCVSVYDNAENETPCIKYIQILKFKCIHVISWETFIIQPIE